MYFPYLRGKQEEVLAVEEAAFLSDLVLPIFEPTSLSRTRAKQYARIADRGGRFALIVNSDHGRPPPGMDDALTFIDDLDEEHPRSVLPAIEIRGSTPRTRIQKFSRRFRNRRCLILHRNHTLATAELRNLLGGLRMEPVHVLVEGGAPTKTIKSLPAAGHVLLRDGFDRQRANRHYPRRSNFDDLMYTHADLGFEGFGDFTITGDTYSASGGPAKHVALHITEHVEDSTIVANHFVSQTPPTKGDVAAKYFSALELMIRHTGNPPSGEYDTQGMRGYLQSYRDRHYPGLGKPKRWSMLHHLEIVDAKLGSADRTDFL